VNQKKNELRIPLRFEATLRSGKVKKKGEVQRKRQIYLRTKESKRKKRSQLKVETPNDHSLFWKMRRAPSWCPEPYIYGSE
jgi:hypothetical protein